MNASLPPLQFRIFFRARILCACHGARQSQARDMEEIRLGPPSGLIAMNLEDGDTLAGRRPTSGKDEVIFVTEQGHALRYSETKIRSMGRQARVCKASVLADGRPGYQHGCRDKDGSLLIVTKGGFGKQTLLKNYTPKGPLHAALPRLTKGIC